MRCRSGGILAPRHLGCVRLQVDGDPVVDADLGTTQSREETLGLVRVDAAVAVGVRVVDAKTSTPRNGASFSKAFQEFASSKWTLRGGSGDQVGRRLSLVPHDERQRPSALLLHHDDDLALAGLVPGQPAVDAVLGVVRRLPVSAEVGAVDVHRAGRAPSVDLGGERLPDLVQEDERRCTGCRGRATVAGRCGPWRRW